MSTPNRTLEQEPFIPEEKQLMERLVERENMHRAYARVMKNKGAAGVDNMSVSALKGFLQTHWLSIKETLLSGDYQPQPVRSVKIPKAGGGERQLGIPTVLDRLLQQAIYQVLNPLFDPEFSEHSYGFREGKSAHQAVIAAKGYQQEGKRWVVDMDLAKFFDEVNHDRLLKKLARKIPDRRLLTLIHRYLKAGMMNEGLKDKGTPQGGPLSPLLSNIVLDELDKELESRGHSFCRYADDCQVYVKTKRSGERVLKSLTEFVERKLKLKVNREKSAVDEAYRRNFLGYSFTSGYKNQEVKLRVPKESIRRLRGKLKKLFREGRGCHLKRFIQERVNPVIRGWISYFGLAEVNRFAEDLDGWIRRRFRLLLWRQWKRRWTRRKRLMAAGLNEVYASKAAFIGRGPWWHSGARHMNVTFRKKHFDGMGLVSMVDELNRLRSIRFRNRRGT